MKADFRKRKAENKKAAVLLEHLKGNSNRNRKVESYSVSKVKKNLAG